MKLPFPARRAQVNAPAVMNDDGTIGHGETVEGTRLFDRTVSRDGSHPGTRTPAALTGRFRS